MFLIALLFQFVLFRCCIGCLTAGSTFRGSSFMRMFEAAKHPWWYLPPLSGFVHHAQGLAGCQANSHPPSLPRIRTTKRRSLAVHTLPLIWRTASFSVSFCATLLRVRADPAAACCRPCCSLCDSVVEAVIRAQLRNVCCEPLTHCSMHRRSWLNTVPWSITSG